MRLFLLTVYCGAAIAEMAVGKALARRGGRAIQIGRSRDRLLRDLIRVGVWRFNPASLTQIVRERLGLLFLGEYCDKNLDEPARFLAGSPKDFKAP